VKFALLYIEKNENLMYIGWYKAKKIIKEYKK